MKKKPDQDRKAKNGKASLIDSSAKFERLLIKSSDGAHYSFRLYITGTTGRSSQAVANIRNLCEKYLHGRYELEVVDIYQQPGKASDAQIIAAPTLVKRLPRPIKRLIGNLSDPEKVIVALDLKKQA